MAEKYFLHILIGGLFTVIIIYWGLRTVAYRKYGAGHMPDNDLYTNIEGESSSHTIGSEEDSLSQPDLQDTDGHAQRAQPQHHSFAPIHTHTYPNHSFAPIHTHTSPNHSSASSAAMISPPMYTSIGPAERDQIMSHHVGQSAVGIIPPNMGESIVLPTDLSKTIDDMVSEKVKEILEKKTLPKKGERLLRKLDK